MGLTSSRDATACGRLQPGRRPAQPFPADQTWWAANHISTNWRGRPLTSHEVVVELIGATTTRTGLSVHAELDTGSYPTGIKVSDKEMAALKPRIRPDRFHGDWNYQVLP